MLIANEVTLARSVKEISMKYFFLITIAAYSLQRIVQADTIM